jgi:hypothetical protein
MPLIQSGKTFNDGEQLTAGKLNQMFSDASLSTAGVDGTSIIVNANDVLAVRSINSSRIDTGAVITDKLPDSTVTATDGTPDGVTLPKLQHIETDKILGRTTTGDGVVEAIGLNTDDAMASASATTLATDGSIKTYVTAMRPKFVSLTGGTTDLVKTTASVSTAEYTYNIADFTSSDSDFGTSKIVALIVQGFTSSNQGQNNVQVRLPNDKFTTICSTSADSSADFTQDHGSTNIPINSGQSSIVIRHSVSDAQTNAAVSTIKGVIIHPGL